MAKEICISSTPHETRLAILEDDQLAEIYYERENEYTLAGSIYNGRVTRVLPGMQSAFVDVGLERDAFLYVTDFLEEQEESEEYERVDGGNGRERRPGAPAAARAAGVRAVAARIGKRANRADGHLSRRRSCPPPPGKHRGRSAHRHVTKAENPGGAAGEGAGDAVSADAEAGTSGEIEATGAKAAPSSAPRPKANWSRLRLSKRRSAPSRFRDRSAARRVAFRHRTFPLFCRASRCRSTVGDRRNRGRRGTGQRGTDRQGVAPRR